MKWGYNQGEEGISGEFNAVEDKGARNLKNMSHKD